MITENYGHKIQALTTVRSEDVLYQVTRAGRMIWEHQVRFINRKGNRPGEVVFRDAAQEQDRQAQRALEEAKKS